MFFDDLPTFPLPDGLRKQWSQYCITVIATGVRVRAAQAKLYDLLRSAGIPFAILKGTAAAQYYPNPSLRAMGDVDFLVNNTDYEPVQKLLLTDDYMPEGDDHENPRHVSFQKNGIHFECHRRFAVQRWKNASLIDSAILSAIPRAGMVNDGTFTFPCLPPAENGLVLLSHVAQHLEEGLGIRQIVDWMMFADKYLDDNGWAGVCGQLIREVGLDSLAKPLTKLCQMYLGLSDRITWCADADEAVAGSLMQLIYHYGNFGQKAALETTIDTVMIHNHRGFLANLRVAGEYNWKLLKKYPWLKPLAPVYQLGRYSAQVIATHGAVSKIIKGKNRVKGKELLLKKRICSAGSLLPDDLRTPC